MAACLNLTSTHHGVAHGSEHANRLLNKTMTICCRFICKLGIVVLDLLEFKKLSDSLYSDQQKVMQFGKARLGAHQGRALQMSEDDALALIAGASTR